MAQIFRKQPAVAPAPDRPKAAPAQPKPTTQKTGVVDRLRTNYNDVMAELRKVTWPTPEETRNLTIVVIGISVAMGIYLGGLDFILSALYNAIAIH